MYKAIEKHKTVGVCDVWRVKEEIVKDSVANVCCNSDCEYVLKISASENEYDRETTINKYLIKKNLVFPEFPIPKMVDNFIEDGKYHIIFERVDMDENRVPENLDVIKLVKKLKENRITHGDIHGGNVVLDKKFGTTMIDFGSANIYKEDGKFIGKGYNEDILKTPSFLNDLEYRYEIDLGASCVIFPFPNMPGIQFEQKTGIKRKEWLIIIQTYEDYVYKSYVGPENAQSLNDLKIFIIETKEFFRRRFPKYDYYYNWEIGKKYKYSFGTIESSGDRTVLDKFNTLEELSKYLDLEQKSPTFKSLKKGLIVEHNKIFYYINNSNKYEKKIKTNYTVTKGDTYSDDIWLAEKSFEKLDDAINYIADYFDNPDYPLTFSEKRKLKKLQEVRNKRIFINPMKI